MNQRHLEYHQSLTDEPCMKNFCPLKGEPFWILTKKCIFRYIFSKAFDYHLCSYKRRKEYKDKEKEVINES